MCDRGKVGEFILYKNSYKLGDEVVGKFCFDDAKVPCYQYTASLQAVEEIADDWQSTADQSAHSVTHSTVSNMALYSHSAETALHIPLTATPTFFTEIVHLKWRLHFEFLLCKGETVNSELWPVGSDPWTAPSQMDVETLVWEVPVKVFPCNPLNACLGSAEPAKEYKVRL